MIAFMNKLETSKKRVENAKNLSVEEDKAQFEALQLQICSRKRQLKAAEKEVERIKSKSMDLGFVLSDSE